jgi:hypothetical protein
MVETRHQVVALARGRHRTPEHGVCAMELAALLSEDRFTDHPARVCPVIGAFLRGYNDALSDRLRNDLFATAAAVLGTRTPSPEVREQRGEAVQAWALAAWRSRRVRTPWRPLFPPENAFGHFEAAGEYAGRVARWNPAFHQQTLRFVESLADAPRSPLAGPRAGAGAGTLSAVG